MSEITTIENGKPTKKATRGTAGKKRDLAADASPPPKRRSEVDSDEALVAALEALHRGDFRTRLRTRSGTSREVATAFNELAERLEQMADEVVRVSRVVGREGDMAERVRLEGSRGGWLRTVESFNTLIGDLVRPSTEVARVLTAVAAGDLSQKMALEIEGKPLRGEYLRIGTTVNTMVEQLRGFSSEVTRVAKEVGTEGILGGQAHVPGVAGTWKDLTDNVNAMAGNLTTQVRGIATVVTAVANGDLSKKLVLETKGEILELKNTVNTMVDQLSSFASEVTRVAKEVGTEGKLGGQANVTGVSGTWKDLTDNVNAMAGNLTVQLRDVSKVATAIADGDLTQKITVDVQGEILQIKNVINGMVDSLGTFADEVTRVAREVGSEGKLGGQAHVPGVAGTWKDLTDSVNSMASNLTSQVRNIALVTTAVAKGDLSQKITVDVKGEILELKNTVNTMVDQLRSFASEVTRVAREVGTEGKLGGQAFVPGVAGTWNDLTDNVNSMASNLTTQVRGIAKVVTAVAKGDLSKRLVVEAKGEIAELAETINDMTETLGIFAEQVTTVAREVGTEGKLGGQARVPGVAGTWKDLTDSVNSMASNLTTQVRGIVRVVTAVANGDLGQKFLMESQGEIAALADTINTMTDTLRLFAEQVTTVAREVGTEGKLGGQAHVPGAAGTWRDLTDNVNQLANNLTDQVRAIAEVSTAVTEGDLTRSITVEAQGEVLALKERVNQMIANLRDTTIKNEEQDWLKTNLARFGSMMQGQKDLENVSRLIMSELTPLVAASHGAFFVAREGEKNLRLLASYAYKERKHVGNSFDFGEGLVGQCALEKKAILLTNVPQDYVKINSGLGEATPLNILVIPVLFEDQVRAVVELASFQPFSPIHRIFLEQLTESIGVVLNMISANMRTEELLAQSQTLAEELKSQSKELQEQQDELKRSNLELEQQAQSLRQSEEMLREQQEELQHVNEELEDKAQLLAEKNRAVEQKNTEVEMGRLALEEKATQLALSSKYKTEFLANMSHELRTPLNSLLILARMLSDNKSKNLTPKQVEYSQTILSAGTDLLTLINEVLDLSKVEAGKIEIVAGEVRVDDLVRYLGLAFRPVANEKKLSFDVTVSPDLPNTFITDGQRLQQVLRNLLSNAFKFTHEGAVTIEIGHAAPMGFTAPELVRKPGRVLYFSVKDSGIGIPQDKHLAIFEAFQQADGTTSRKYGGTGLGLSISRELVRLLGGEIRLESEPGQGSTFTLFLPLDGPDAGVRTRAETPVSDVDLRLDEDDRHRIQLGDSVILVVEEDRTVAQLICDMAHERGFKVVVTSRPETALAFADRLTPAALVLDLILHASDGLQLLGQLKRSSRTRHIPVHVLAQKAEIESVRRGAIGSVERPFTRDRLAELFKTIERFTSGEKKRLIVVGSEEDERKKILDVIGGDDVVVATHDNGPEALAELEVSGADCIVLGLGTKETLDFELVKQFIGNEAASAPLIVHSARALSEAEEKELRELMDTAVLHDVRTPERLLDDATLFLHRKEKDLPEEKRRMLEDLRAHDEAFVGKKILVIDDDVRNVFALAAVLESSGMDVVYAEGGEEGLSILDQHANIDLVLTDVMMPNMDGYETMRRIRKNPRLENLPIVALTAKAMKGDRDKCLEAGASDYVTKPVDPDRLLSLMRVWLDDTRAKS